MLKPLKRSKLAVCTLLFLAAQSADADLLFTNWSGTIVGGNLYTAGGPCAIASCFAIADNFNNPTNWVITDMNVYIVGGYPGAVTSGGFRYALFTEAGDQVVAPTDVAVTFTDLGNYFSTYEIYAGAISGLNISLPPGEYQLRFTNTIVQQIFPAYGSATSPQTIPPGLVSLTGSSTVEALLSTDVTQDDGEWAFDISGTEVPIFADGFEGP